MYLNILPKSSDLFSGREKELQKIEKLFDETNIFCIEGISGIGKTALMLKWANILAKKDKYRDRILWLECQKDWTLDKLLMEINNWLVNNGESLIKDYLKEIPFKIEEKILYIINQLNKKNYVLFIDDFQNIKQVSSEIFISTIKNYIRNTRIYLISNEAFSLSPAESMDIPRIRIKGLEAEDSLLLLKKFFTFHDFDDIPEDNILAGIIDNSRGHPLYLKTFSGLVISRIFTYNDIIKDKYIEKDIGNIIFKKASNNLSLQEKNILELLSACRISLSLEAIIEISHLEGLAEILLLLESRMLIEKDEACRYLIHPLLKDYIWKELSPERKNELHKIFGEYFEKNEEFPREAFYHFVNGGDPRSGAKILGKIMIKLYSLGYYEELMEKFKILGTYIPLTEEMEVIKANILVNYGKWSESLSILEDVKNKIINEDLLGEVYLSLARLYVNMYGFQKAVPFYESSLEIFRKAGDCNKIVKTLNRFAYLSLVSGEVKKSSHLIKESFSMLEKEPDEVRLGEALRIKSQILAEKRQYEEALDVLEECLILAKKMSSVCLMTRIFDDRGKIFLKLHRYDEAIKSFEDNLALGNELGDKVIIACSYTGLATVFYEICDMDKSMDFIKKSLNIYRSIGNKMFVAICEFNLASIYEIKGEIKRAIEIFSEVKEKAMELSFEKLKITSEVKIMDNSLKLKELYPHREELLNIKKNMPQDLIKERVNLILLLSDMYLKENKYGEMEASLEEALELSEKEDYLYGLVKTCYIMSKISNKNKQERERLRKKATENFEKLALVEKKELEYLFNGTEEKIEKRFLVKTRESEFNASLDEAEQLRNEKEAFDIFIDVPNKSVFEKKRGEINIFKKKRVLSLLLFLIRNKRGFSSEEIYREVWGWEYEGDASETDVRKNICRIRELIEPDREILKYILLKEGLAGEKGKYYFNDKVKFCLVDNVL